MNDNVTGNDQSEYKPLNDELYSKLMADMEGIREKMQNAGVESPTFVDPNGSKMAGYAITKETLMANKSSFSDRMQA